MSASSLSDCACAGWRATSACACSTAPPGVTPTTAGERLLERLRPALEEIHAAFNDLDDESQRPVGTLLNVPVPVARFVLPDLLNRFLKLYPAVNVEVVMDNTFIDVIAATTPVCVTKSLAKDMIAIPIGPRRQRFVAAAAPAYLAAHGTPPPSEADRASTARPSLRERQAGRIRVREGRPDLACTAARPAGHFLT